MSKLKKIERQQKLIEQLEADPFLTDDQLSQLFNVSIQTIRLDRIELNIPELRERIKTVAKEDKENIRSLSIQEVIGEIIEIELDHHAYSLFIVENAHVFEKNKIARGHLIFAQANSLCVAVINHPIALTKSAQIDFLSPVKLHDKVVSKATVTKMDGRIAYIRVESKVKQNLVFKGEFEMYYKNVGELNG